MRNKIVIIITIALIILLYIFLGESKTKDVVNETINENFSIGYKEIVKRDRVSNDRIHLTFLPLKGSLAHVDESLYRNEWTDLLETNDTLQKIANSNKCILYKSNGAVIRFNYIDYSEEIKKKMEEKLGKNLDEWTSKEIGYLKKGNISD